VSPFHTYTTAGVYDVSLTVTGPSGFDTIVKPNLVNVSPPLAVFTDLGGGSPGALFGVPELSVTSSLLPGENFAAQLIGTPPVSLTMVWISFASTPVPAFNGVVHPFPPAQQLFFFTSLFGVIDLNTTWPSGIAAGLDIFLQFFVQDGSVVEGVTLSNAVKGTTP
jgi:PKD repeat protein